ncbi:MAG: hypothetical protein IOB85_12985 [Methylobacterium sp.]|nr:hypothetical protein [Methylobacterium sp.]MCA3659126.1 hypothetical protein [Methylobacterium sp.]MCA3661145.1 hypothetical protein [Methylobacterium sp.]MCA3663082.1 hypothetical protein [Methylobacterium sp.]MCA3666678.1 hypothetical protein [Methylobacterium sp.]
MSDFFSSVFRSFADPFFAFLQGRSVTPQIDFGNFMVGLATMAVATVSIYVSYSSGVRDSRRRVADLREEWMENLRKKLAEFSELSHNALNLALDIHLSDRNAAPEKMNEMKVLLSKTNSSLVGVEAYIALMLNEQERLHRVIREIIAQTRGRVATFSHEPQTRLSEQAHDLLRLLEKNSRVLLKNEWNRTKSEMIGRSKLYLLIVGLFYPDETKKIVIESVEYIRDITSGTVSL